MSISYEWCAELKSIITVVRFSYKNLHEMLNCHPPTPHTKYCLTRYNGNMFDGVTNTQRAYLKDGELPELFDGGAIVPEKHKLQTQSKRNVRLLES